MKIQIILTILAAILLAGCTSFKGNKSVPSNRYKDKEKEVELAQDSRAKNILIEKKTVDKDGNTNYVTIKIDGLEGKNNPDVVEAAGNANVNSILAGGQVFNQGFQAGQNSLLQLAAMFGQSQGLNTKAPTPPTPPVMGIPITAPVPKENLIIEGVEYIPIQYPDPVDGGVIVYKGPVGGSYVRSADGKKMIRLP